MISRSTKFGLALLVIASSMTLSAEQRSAAQLLFECTSTEPGGFEFCMGFLSGIAATSALTRRAFATQKEHHLFPVVAQRMTCLDQDIRKGEFVLAFADYLESNPEASRGSAAEVAILSLEAWWPCN